MDFRDTPDYHGHIEVNLNACLISFSTVIYGLRIYNRAFMTKTLGLDDTVSYGSGAHLRLIPQFLLEKFFSSLVIQVLVYFCAVAMVRLAILAFLPRLTSDKSVRIMSLSIAIAILAQTVTVVAYRLAECTPIRDIFRPPTAPGLHCVGPVAHNMMMVGHAASSVAIDLALLLLPIWVIYSKMMWSTRTVRIILVLSVGLFAVMTGIVRLALMMTRDFSSDATYQMATLGIWTNLEGHIGLWCGCFPALQSLLRSISHRLGFRSSLASTSSNIMYKPNDWGDEHTLGWRSTTKHGHVHKGSEDDTAETIDGESECAIAVPILAKEIISQAR
ncbi:hypothetical protein F4775DRAFT_589622 [Biscogniauxia sp. FL1348]|nr:hypothetical protein F4775DRAFT_589622 [Biscogniauxia sp. FL1348]